MKYTIYIDIVNSWCRAQEAQHLIDTGLISDNGQYWDVITKSTSLDDLQIAVEKLVVSKEYKGD